jgi:hypothetical protein
MNALWIVLITVLWGFAMVLGVAVLGVSQRLGQLESSGVQLIRAAADNGPTVGTTLDLPVDLLLRLSPDGQRQDLVILFLSSSCGPCQDLAHELRAAEPDGTPGTQSDEYSGSTLLVTDEDGLKLYADLPQIGEIVPQAGGDVARVLGVSVSPYLLAMTAEGIVTAAQVPSSVKDLTQAERTLSRPTLNILSTEGRSSSAVGDQHQLPL